YICNLQGSFTPGSPAIGFHKSLDTTLILAVPYPARRYLGQAVFYVIACPVIGLIGLLLDTRDMRYFI
ncbi:hypothetical protein, partial [[Clostridium] symbiosum]|uniref:hypothetical protein n=1 Tax=Clostridium symbiosum TaxID=1512 RepID=UPI001A9BC75B